LKRHAEKSFDVIHCHDWLTVKAGIELKKRLGIPLVVTFHSTEFDRTANLWPFWWIVAAERDAVLNADLIIAVSERIKRELVEQYGANPFKVRVVYNAIDQSELKSEAKKEHLGVSGNVVLFHGRLSVQKGPEFFLKAAKKVLEKNKGVRFVLSGKGDLLPRLVDLSIELGISDKVTFTGYLPQEQLADLYAVSDVFVLPAVSEPFGITVLEAMAAGVPCVISKTTGVGEIVNHCLRVDFWDVDELANKILGLLNYSELKELVKREAIREVKKFTWEDCASKTLWVYSEALRNRNN
jgi:glycosyltransferase involved in cell wall biosynthesis